MRKIEYTSIGSDIHSFKEMGKEGWIYTYCPAMENIGRMVFYREEQVKRKTVSSERPEEPEDFVAFYKIYPNKKARPMALKMWIRLKSQEKIDAMKGLKKYILVWKQKQTPIDKIPYPATFLNPKDGRRWEDTIDMQGIKTPEEIAQQEKRKIAMEKQRIADEEQQKNDEKEIRAVVKRVEYLKTEKKDTYEEIEKEARIGFPEKTQQGQFFKAILDARIRAIVREKYMPKKV